MFPSLVHLCILALLPYADQLDVLSVKLSPRGHIKLEEDVRLWAVQIQVYERLPKEFGCLAVKSLDRVPVLKTHAFLTVLDIGGCKELTDESIVQLRTLHSLAAFNGSETSLSGYGIQSLASTLQVDSLEGPWPLRVLFLRNCPNMTDNVYSHLMAFPLLSLIDLRATKCTLQGASFPFQPSTDESLFHSVSSALASLYHPPYTLNITSFGKSLPESNPSRRLTYNLTRPSFASSSLLRLSRPPLPYSALNSFIQQSLKRKEERQLLASRGPIKAKVDWHNERGTKSKLAMEHLLKLRSTSQSAPASLPDPETSTSSHSRNPFRKNPISTPPQLRQHEVRRMTKKPKPSTSFDWKAWSDTP